jgi:dsDNA-binding SOS-regulon protein
MAGIKLHPRTMVVQKAERDLHDRLSDVADEHDLSWTEMAIILGNLQTNALKYVLREERHPEDPDRKGDEA